ncbi:MAG: hypothetical protein FD181_3748 [Prolixibacteraceae bacterium]|nr:MAG: hypothetical protein FD181_3748 [Prolixibacteraceae bacterium]
MRQFQFGSFNVHVSPEENKKNFCFAIYCSISAFKKNGLNICIQLSRGKATSVFMIGFI